MTYVYLKTPIPDITDIEVNDVGVAEKANDTIGMYNVKFLRSGITMVVDPSHLAFFDIHDTGDKYEYKVCDRCFKRLSSETMFSNNRHKKDNFITKRPSCKLCRKLKDGVSIPSADRAEWMRVRPADGAAFTCPICRKTTIVGITKIVLDHNHNNGSVRGWLCESCNTGIGRFDDSPEVVKRALLWLQNN